MKHDCIFCRILSGELESSKVAEADGAVAFMDLRPFNAGHVLVTFFYRAGRQERSWGMLWAGLSIGASIVALRLLPGGMLGVLAAQAALFVGITAYRMRFRCWICHFGFGSCRL